MTEPAPQPPAIDQPGGALLRVLVQPRASRTRCVGLHDNALKIQLAAPPVDGEANAALIAFVAKALGVGKSCVALRQGATGRRKSLFVAGVTAKQALERLLAG